MKAGEGRGHCTSLAITHNPKQQNQPDTQEAASDNTNSTTIGSGGSQNLQEQLITLVRSDWKPRSVALLRFGIGD